MTGKYRVPVGVADRYDLAGDGIAPGHVATYLARMEARGSVVGFVCLTPDLTVRRLQIGRNRIAFSSDGFPSEAAQQPGILFPPHRVEISQDLFADFENLSSSPVFPRAYYLIDLETD